MRPTLAVAAPLRVRPAEQAPSQGRRGLRTATRHRRAPAVRTKQEGTHAHRGQAGDRRRAAPGACRQPDADRLRVPRPHRQGDRGDPSRPAQAGRELPRREEPPDADRRPGHDRRGPRPAARRSDGDRLRQRRVADGQGRHRRNPAVQAGDDHRRRAGRPGDRRRRRQDAGQPAVARGPARASSPAGCRRRSRRWPACSPRTSGTSARRSPRSATRRPRPRAREPRPFTTHHQPIHPAGPPAHRQGDQTWRS